MPRRYTSRGTARPAGSLSTSALNWATSFTALSPRRRITSPRASPARAAVLTLEVREDGRALRDELCTDASGRDSLPMLQFALRALHEHAIARGDHLLRLDDYEAMDRAAGALSRAAEDTLNTLPAAVQAAFPRVLRALVDLNQQSSARAARNAALVHFADDSDAKALIDVLVKHRLLSQFDLDGQLQVRVVHESLFTHWRRADEQIENEKEHHHAQKRLESAYHIWRNPAPGEHHGRLLSGPDLEEALALQKALGGFSPGLTAFIEESQRKKKRRHRMKVAFAVIGAVIVVGVVIFAIWAIEQRDRAEMASAQAEATLEDAARRALGRAQEQLVANRFAEQAAYLAESLGYAEIPETMMSASMALQQMAPVPILHQLTHSDRVDVAKYSPDGSRLVTAVRIDGEIPDKTEGATQLFDGLTLSKVGDRT